MLEKLLLATSDLPDVGGLTSWGQEQGEAILVLILIGVIVVFAFKREWGALIGGVIIIALIINIVKNPDETILQWVSGLIDKLMNRGGT